MSTPVEISGMAANRCACRSCQEADAKEAGRPLFTLGMVVCPSCGDKRCVRAQDHTAPCAKDDLYEHNAWVERNLVRR